MYEDIPNICRRARKNINGKSNHPLREISKQILQLHRVKGLLGKTFSGGIKTKKNAKAPYLCLKPKIYNLLY